MTRIFRHWPLLVLALWFVGMTVALDYAMDLFGRRCTTDPANLAAPAPWRESRLFVDPDSYAWLAYARDLRASPHFRVRHTSMDNAPYGRPVHWAQLPIWSLCAIASALETFGIQAPDSLELAGRILLPLLGLISFSALWFFLRRRVQPSVAALSVFAYAVLLFWNFHPLRPDHHGYHLAAAAAFVLPLLFSSLGFAAPTRRNRLPFLLSGFFGGVALWLGATVFYFTLAAAAIAAALALLPCRSLDAPPQDSAVWRFWGLAGFATSLFFYLLEYAPNHFSMRLEANHPLYALSFLGIGETLFCLARFRHVSPSVSPLRILHFLLALATAAALPALVLFGPVSWYIPRSALMLRLHAVHILEFLSVHAFCSQHSFPYYRVLIPPLLPAIAAFILCRRPFSRQLLFATPFFFVFFALFLWQNRWETFASFASLLPLLAVCSTPRMSDSVLSSKATPPRPAFFRLVPRFLPHAALSVQLAFALWNQLLWVPGTIRGDSFDTMYFRSFQHRALATQFREALADPAVTPTPNASAPIALAPPEFAPYLYYFARIPAIASLYWENLPGNAAAAEAFADLAPDAPSAHAIVSERRISHLFMVEGGEDIVLFDHLHTGIVSASHAVNTFGGMLACATPGIPLPPWIAVDTDLNRLANPDMYVFIPRRKVFAPTRFPVRIYSLMPPS